MATAGKTPVGATIAPKAKNPMNGTGTDTIAKKQIASV